MFRLKIDFPLGENETEAAKLAYQIVAAINVVKIKDELGVTKMQYLLARDEDTKVRNYLIKDDQGHVSTKKIVADLS